MSSSWDSKDWKATGICKEYPTIFGASTLLGHPISLDVLVVDMTTDSVFILFEGKAMITFLGEPTEEIGNG